MKRKNLILCLLVVLVAAGAGYFIWENQSSKSEAVSYAEFYQAVEAGNIKTAKIDGDKVYFEQKDGKGDLVTVNPHSPVLEEFLLKNGVEVSVVKDGGEIFSLIFDVLFYISFLV